MRKWMIWLIAALLVVIGPAVSAREQQCVMMMEELMELLPGIYERSVEEMSGFVSEKIGEDKPLVTGLNEDYDIFDFPVGEEYLLRVMQAGNQIDYAYFAWLTDPNCNIQISRSFDAEAIEAFMQEVELLKPVKHKMTMQDVRALSEKGELIGWEDFEPFIGWDMAGGGSGGQLLYDVDEDYLLMVVPEFMGEKLEICCLELKAERRYRVDIRTGDIDKYLAGAEEAGVPKPVMTVEDVIALSKKGYALRSSDFLPFMGEYDVLDFQMFMMPVEGGYELRIFEEKYGGEEPTAVRLRLDDDSNAMIDIRVHDVAEFVNAEDKSAYRPSSRKLTMEDVMKLAELGDDFRKDHMLHYMADLLSYADEVESPSGVNVVESYPVGEAYHLQIGSESFFGEVRYVRLVRNETEEYIEIREGDILRFVEETQELPEKSG